MNEIKLIETNGKKVLILEVPEGASEFETGTRTLFFNDFRIDIPFGDWQILGKSTELSEEQKGQVVECLEWEGLVVYILYPDDPKKRRFTASRDESYLSWLKANEIVDRNPYGDYESAFVYSPLSFNLNELEADQIKWQEAQKQVRTYIILIGK